MITVRGPFKKFFHWLYISKTKSRLMRFGMYYIGDQQALRRACLRIRAVSPEPLLFAHMPYGNRRRVRPKTDI